MWDGVLKGRIERPPHGHYASLWELKAKDEGRHARRCVDEVGGILFLNYPIRKSIVWWISSPYLKNEAVDESRKKRVASEGFVKGLATFCEKLRVLCCQVHPSKGY